MLKSHEYLKIMGNALYWQFRYIDAMEEITVHVDDSGEVSQNFMSCTEGFLLDVVESIIACSEKPRDVLRQLPWFREMLAFYPKVKKVFRMATSSEFQSSVNEYKMTVPTMMITVFHMVHSDSFEEQFANYLALLKLMSEFFRLFGTMIYTDGFGNPLREEEFSALAEKLDSIGNNTYPIEELRKEYPYC